MSSNHIDKHGEAVLQFQLRSKNLSRIGELTDLIVEMGLSGDWRDYTIGTGHERWRKAEFDYFLIACEVAFEDAARVLAHRKESAELAPLMDREADRRNRRPLEEAAKAYHPPGFEGLVEAAERLGWRNPNAPGGIGSPVPERARQRAKGGESKEEQASQRRAERIPAKRRRELDALAGDLAGGLNEREGRYLIDNLRRKLVADEFTRQKADAERLDWNVAQLAEHWEISRMAAHKRVQKLREG
jgi:hypothetical protein